MKLVRNIIKFLKSEGYLNSSNSPEGFCPNCWGREEYGGQFYEAVKLNGTNINAKDANVGWIQDYVNRNLSSIKLVPKDDKLVCEKCKIAYKPVLNE